MGKALVAGSTDSPPLAWPGWAFAPAHALPTNRRSSEVEKLWIASHLIEVVTKKLSSRRHMTQFSSLEWEEEAIGTGDSWDSDNE